MVHVPYPNEYRNCLVPKTGGRRSRPWRVEWIEKRFFKLPRHRRVSPASWLKSFSEVIRAGAKDFSDGLRRICDYTGIMLIADEVQSGMGRTEMFASEYYDPRPTSTIMKGIGSGLPIGANAARADLMNWKPGAHASNVGGNPVCIASALKTIELLQTGWCRTC